MTGLQHQDDPLSLTPPQDPYFDERLQGWVLTRHRHVAAAFREPLLIPTGARAKTEIADGTAVVRKRERTLAALPAEALEEWRRELESIASQFGARLAGHRTVDLAGEFAGPWCLRAALLVTGADPAHAGRLAELARAVSDGAAEPLDDDIRRGAAAANEELERFSWRSDVLGAAVFVALSQTLPCFLANAWLALLRHPAELSRLHEQPEMMPRAIEELLRYAGVARMIFRQAGSDVEIAGIELARGERAVLMLASANRDPEQFVEPDRLDLERRAASHVALGFGPHSCAGGQLIRMAAAISTRVFAEFCDGAQIEGQVKWRGGAGFRAPESLPVMLAR